MSIAFDKAFPLTLAHEGGYVDHPRDPGGATNLGVTIGTLSAYLGRRASKADVRALTPAAVKPIYKKNYWDAVDGDLLNPGVAYALYDYAVNSGPKRAVLAVQRLVGVADDGRLGPITRKAIAERDPAGLVGALCDERMRFLQRLSTWNTFGKGWSRRVSGVRSEALKMVGLSVASAPAPPARPEPVAVPVEMQVPKPWYESKIKVSAAVGGVCTLLGVFGIAVSPEDQQSYAEIAWHVAPFVGTGLTAAVAWFSRNKPQAPIIGTAAAAPPAMAPDTAPGLPAAAAPSRTYPIEEDDGLPPDPADGQKGG